VGLAAELSVEVVEGDQVMAGGEAGLHVVGAPGIEPVALDARREAVGGASQADGVEVAAQQQPATPFGHHPVERR
jgi:hypothetical protein